MLKIQNLWANYGEVNVLENINMSIAEGKITAIVGANAAGKSTLVSCISGLKIISQGSIIFEGEDIANVESCHIVEKGLIQIPEGRLLFPKLTVRENLELGAYGKRSRKGRKERIEHIYSLLPRLKERETQLAGSLSGGEAQMCAIGRGLMANPKLLILDEPSLGLSPIMVQEIMDLICDIREKGTTVLLVEQNVRQSLKIADKAYILENGKVKIEGTGKDLLISDEIRKAYLGI